MAEELREKAIREMSAYFGSSTEKAEERIAHTLDVLANAERILEGEAVRSEFVREVAVLAALFHDIGIPESERKYGSTEPKHQHQEGPPITRSILTKLGVRADILERVCFIVGNHHTRDAIDNTDFQIVYEADYIVNTKSNAARGDRKVTPEQRRRMNGEHLRSKTAARLIEEVL